MINKRKWIKREDNKVLLKDNYRKIEDSLNSLVIAKIKIIGEHLDDITSLKNYNYPHRIRIIEVQEVLKSEIEKVAQSVGTPSAILEMVKNELIK